MTILWFLDLDPVYGMRNGATLRYANYSRALVSAGHRVCYVLTNYPGKDPSQRRDYLTRLQAEGYLSEFFEFDIDSVPRRASVLASLTVYPAFRDRVLARYREDLRRRVHGLIERVAADACILSHRVWLFLSEDLARRTALIIDWCDSQALFQLRELQVRRRSRNVRAESLPRTLRILAESVAEEGFYGRYADANIAVSPGDKRALDRLNGNASRNFVMANGVGITAPPETPGDKGVDRLIFTGSMNFPPNYQGAIWFIDNVLPLLVRQRPGARLVIAGQEPVAELISRANDRVTVTGLVPDIRAEISKSRLYVAPLVSGTGFRNKIVEALASGTYVVGTTLALDFLDERFRSRMLTGDTPAELAAAILTFLEDPASFDTRLRELVGLVRETFPWELRVREFVELCERVVSARAQAGATRFSAVRPMG